MEEKELFQIIKNLEIQLENCKDSEKEFLLKTINFYNNKLILVRKK